MCEVLYSTPRHRAVKVFHLPPASVPKKYTAEIGLGGPIFAPHGTFVETPPVPWGSSIIEASTIASYSLPEYFILIGHDFIPVRQHRTASLTYRFLVIRKRLGVSL